MIAADGYFTYTGREAVPHYVTRVRIHESVTVIPARAFYDNRNIKEVECHIGVVRVEEEAFLGCLSLRRVIMPGVKVVEYEAFINCYSLTDVECGKLEIIQDRAFSGCKSLRSIDLPSAKIVENGAFEGCEVLTDVKFGSKLDRVERVAFANCYALERITIPLKDGMISRDTIFSACANLKHVDLVEGELHETVAALQLQEWRNDIMNVEINSINQILPTVDAGSGWDGDAGEFDEGGKAQAIRMWIRSVLRKIVHYKAEHQRLLDEEVATTLQLILPQEIVMNNVLPFLELP
eukprot:scaffold4795_cov191-Skeletonema_marinoi.AAC.3